MIRPETHFTELLDKYMDDIKDSELKAEALELSRQARADDMFNALPLFYTKKDDRFQYTYMDDAIGSVRQDEWIEIARDLRDGDCMSAGERLKNALMRVCLQMAEDEE